MKSPTSEAQCAGDVLQTQSPIFGVNGSINISMTKVRINESKTNLTRPLKPLK